jgi:hypothetical protein
MFILNVIVLIHQFILISWRVWYQDSSNCMDWIREIDDRLMI